MLAGIALVACSEFFDPQRSEGRLGDDLKRPQFATGSVCHTSGDWENFAIPAQTGSFTALFEGTPGAINIDAMTGLSSGPAGVWSDQAVVVRFGPTGAIQALNGSTWSAATSIPYSAGVTYRIRLVVNVPAHTYSAYVAPVGGNEKTLATDYAFRPETNSVTNLDHWHTRAYSGSHEVCDFTAVTNSSNTSGNWTNFPLGTQTGSFWAEFDGTPNATNIDAMTGFSSGPAAVWSDQAVVVRFGSTGVIQALNGSSWSAVTSVPYSAATTYHFRLFVNVTAHTYTAYVRPAGGTEVTLANNYDFRPETNTVTSLDHWHTRAYTGSHQTSNFIAQGSGGGGGSGAPTVTTNAASAIRTTSATLNGSGDPNGAATTGWFRYSTTNPGSCNDTFGTRSPSTGGTSLGSGTTAVAYSRGISNLTGGRVYYFCAIASNSAGTGFGTVQSFRAGRVGLRSGPAGLGPDSTGMGPGDDMVGPSYSFILEATPELNKVREHIALADQHDVVLMMAPSRGRGGWAPGGNFSWSLYEAKVREFQSDTTFRRAVNQRRVLLYVVDEPQHPDFNGTISPTEVNQMGLLHKEIWPGALTFVRMSGNTLTNGWDNANGVNQPPPAGGYTGLDYGWLQYSAATSDSTFAQVYAVDKQKLAALNMGMVPGINWWAGGIGHLPGQNSLDGVNACWDINNNNSSSGYIVGIDQPAPYSEGTKYNCGSLPTGVTRTVVSPEWFRRWADVVFSDADAPFVAYWRHPDDSATIPGAEALGKRSDFVSALDYVITKTASRTSWNGYRTPK